MMEESDAVAIAGARAGDPDAFRVLVERHSHALFRLAYRMTSNEQDSEDIVQETLLRAYQRLDRFESRASFSTWLFRIAANCSLDLLRRRRRRDEPCDPLDSFTSDMIAPLASSPPTPDRAILNREIGREVEAVLEQLTPLERAAFVLRHFESRSIAEIGDALELGPSAAKQAVFRAVQKMRRSLEPIACSHQ